MLADEGAAVVEEWAFERGVCVLGVEEAVAVDAAFIVCKQIWQERISKAVGFVRICTDGLVPRASGALGAVASCALINLAHMARSNALSSLNVAG